MRRGYYQTTLGIIPNNWRVLTVKQLVSDKILEKPLDGNHGEIHPKSDDYVSSGVPFVMANNFLNGKLNLENCNFIKKELADKLQKGFSVTGDVLLTHKGTVGSTAIVGKLNTDYIMLTPQVTYYRVKDLNRLSNYFVRHYFDSPKFQFLLSNLAGGGTRAYLGIVKQLDLPIIMPPIDEQNVIAKTLSDVDELLEGLNQLIKKKKNLKKATMQKLLTGKVQLPGFKVKFEEKTLGDIVKFKKGQLITSSTLIPGNIPVIAGGKEPAYFNSTANRYGCTITISASGANAGYVAMHTNPIFASDCTTISDSKKFCINYIFYQLLLKQNLIYDSQTGGAQPHISEKDLSPIKILMPNSVIEQKTISKVLCDMDLEIKIIEQRLEKTFLLKKAMMQELLTGKIRLTKSEKMNA